MYLLVLSIFLLTLASEVFLVWVTQRGLKESNRIHEAHHAEALSILADLNKRRDMASGLRAAAEKWEDPLSQPYLAKLARDKYTPGGTSMPAIFLRIEADEIEGITRGNGTRPSEETTHGGF